MKCAASVGMQLEMTALVSSLYKIEHRAMVFMIAFYTP